jgi:hypothetical protein
MAVPGSSGINYSLKAGICRYIESETGVGEKEFGKRSPGFVGFIRMHFGKNNS